MVNGRLIRQERRGSLTRQCDPGSSRADGLWPALPGFDIVPLLSIPGRQARGRFILEPAVLHGAVRHDSESRIAVSPHSILTMTEHSPTLVLVLRSRRTIQWSRIQFATNLSFVTRSSRLPSCHQESEGTPTTNLGTISSTSWASASNIGHYMGWNEWAKPLSLAGRSNITRGQLAAAHRLMTWVRGTLGQASPTQYKRVYRTGWFDQ